MLYTLMYSASEINHIYLKLGEKSLKTLMMLPFENCEFSSNGGGVVVWRISMSRHEQTNRCNSTPDGQILSKLITFDECPGLKISTV